MNDRIVLVFDVGTQSSRAELVNERGEILGKSQIGHEPPYVSKEPGIRSCITRISVRRQGS